MDGPLDDPIEEEDCVGFALSTVDCPSPVVTLVCWPIAGVCGRVFCPTTVTNDRGVMT
ncbi:hypothetical protein DPMN_114981 [Dreissena polymorpha]|uniref:Uncharacterized protein n=1 Tax=Dreissena polymorpha TaxID=45954 RepID=A0A9D4QS22_DREPO|nr:hypothetical protein DPMN_114981 [Dreissena polymorpha]